MVKKAQCNGLIKGLDDNLVPNGVAVLQYADDTIMCLKDDMQKARNMKFLLYLYEQMAGLKINFSKSEISMINGDDMLGLQYAELFNCQLGGFPIRYFGVPVSPSKLHIIDWAPLLEKNKKTGHMERGGAMSIAGRTTLINSSLTSTFIYHMSMYLLPKTIVNELDKQRRKFFWQGGGHKKKYQLVRWEVICKSKKRRTWDKEH
jgi:hypothetical protein